MGNVKKFEQFISEVSEKKKASSEKVGDNVADAKKLNKGYNWSAFPEGSKSKDKWYSNTHTNTIEIGDPDPVKKFKEWNGKYWRSDSSKKQKDEPRKEKGQKNLKNA